MIVDTENFLNSHDCYWQVHKSNQTRYLFIDENTVVKYLITHHHNVHFNKNDEEYPYDSMYYDKLLECWIPVGVAKDYDIAIEKCAEHFSKEEPTNDEEFLKFHNKTVLNDPQDNGRYGYEVTFDHPNNHYSYCITECINPRFGSPGIMAEFSGYVGPKEYEEDSMFDTYEEALDWCVDHFQWVKDYMPTN